MLGALVGVSPGGARAEAPTAAVRYVAPPGCPGPFKFLSLIEERSAGRWQVRQGDGHSDFVVEIRDGAAGKVGRVQRADRPGEGAREIASADCGELVQALALSTVLSLDARADAGGTDPVVAMTSPREQVARASWIVGGGASNTFLLQSDAMPGLSLFVENGRRLSPGGLAIRQPELRLALTHARNDQLGGDRARFTLSVANLSVCPIGVGFSETVSLRLCGAAEAGVLSGEGVAVGTPLTSRFFWAAGGGVARLRWATGRRMVVEAHAGGVAPFERTTFIFEMPRVEVAKVPGFVVSAGLAVGWAIP